MSSRGWPDSQQHVQGPQPRHLPDTTEKCTGEQEKLTLSLLPIRHRAALVSVPRGFAHLPHFLCAGHCSKRWEQSSEKS